ncbi:MAG: YlxM family DNA-binding protein [Oscillospiraceae bacterium]|nr:YlxM family DNA-binding protein [Oscillospiraceae bacterium]
MPKNLKISVLLDYYGGMLTEKQREVAEWYYNEDLSLAEIAEHSGITRQGVRDSIKRAESQLVECETKMGLHARFVGIQKSLDEISEQASYIQEESARVAGGGAFWNRAQRIMDLTDEISW